MAYREQLQVYLQALRDRGINFRDFNKILRDAEMPTERGWDLLFPKYSAITNEDTCEKYLGILQNIYHNHILYAERALVVIRLDDGLARTLIQNSTFWDDSNSPFRLQFPLPLSQEALASISSGSFVTKTTIFKNAEKILVVSCEKRYVRSRIAIDLLEYSEDTRDAFAGFDEVIGVKSKYVQAFDAFILNEETNIAILSIDICGSTSMDDIGRSVASNVQWFQKCIEISLMNVQMKWDRFNFFPRIIGLYNEPDGSVEKVGHVTQSGSNKHERMRKKGVDLRTEPFHRNGLAAIKGGTDLFSITKSWCIDNDYFVGATIPGHFSKVNEENPVIGTALTSGCRNESDFLFVLNKLIQ